MNLTEFNNENTVPQRNASAASFSINQKNGLFNLNKTFCQHLALKPGDGIVLQQDQDEPENWYLEKNDNKNKAFFLREKTTISKGLLLNNTALARSIFKSIDVKDSYVRGLVAGQPTKVGKHVLWGLIFLKQ